MDAADILYGVSMGGDGVTKVVSRRLPREEAAAADDSEGPPPFAGIAPEDDAVDTGADDAAAGPEPDSAEAA